MFHDLQMGMGRCLLMIVTQSLFYPVNSDAGFAVDYHGYITASECFVEDSSNFEYRAVNRPIFIVNIWMSRDIKQIAINYGT